MNVIILCGGLSTRLGDITKTTPKILLDIGPKRVLEWQLEKVQKLGVKQVVLAVGHLADAVKEALGETWNGMQIVYAVEKKKLGTGGAIKHALTYVADRTEPTLVINGDVLTNVDIVAMTAALKPDSDGIILAAHVEDVADYGTLIYDDAYKLSMFKEKEGVHKPGYMNGGYYLFNPSVEAYFPVQDTFSVEYDVLPKVQNLYVYESDDAWVDIGLPERLEWARENWEEFE